MELFKNMDLFVAVAKACSFRGAAEALGLPNSTVSRRVAQLEQSLGLRLFNRSTRRVDLTEAGQLYFQHCKRLIEEAELAHLELSRLHTEPSGVIRASLPVDFSVLYLAPLLADFAQRYPRIRFDLDLTPAQTDLRSEPVDLSIRIGAPHADKEGHLIARPLAKLARGLFASPTYLAQHGNPSSPQELLQHQCLRVFDADWTLTHTPTQTSHSVAISGTFVANNIGMLRQLALHHQGIFLATPSMITADLAQGDLLRILPDWEPSPVQVYALTTTRLLSTKVRTLLDYLVERLQ